MVLWNSWFSHRRWNTNSACEQVFIDSWMTIRNEWRSPLVQLVGFNLSIYECCFCRFVKLEYYPAHTLDKCLSLFEQFTLQENDNQFVEGLMFNKDQGVIMVGNMVTSVEPGKVSNSSNTTCLWNLWCSFANALTAAVTISHQLNKIGLWYKPWFFKHVEQFLRGDGPVVEYIPLRDYYHRHSRSIFWEIQEIIPFGNHSVFRYLLGWMVPPKVSLLKLTQPAAVKKLYEENHLIQDMLVPLNKLRESILKFDDLTKVSPAEYLKLN